MKKFAILLFAIVFTANMSFAEEIKWTVERNSSSSNVSEPSTVLETKSSRFGNVDFLKLPIKRQVITSATSDLKTDTVEFDAILPQSIVSRDPFVIKIDGVKYYMVQNNSIVGQDSTLENIYEPLFKMDKNKDKNLTSQEMKNSNIRFVRLNNKGQLEIADKSLDYPLINIAYIDLNTLRKTNNTGKLGSFGYFDIYINKDYQLKRFIGQITYEDEESINKLLGK